MGKLSYQHVRLHVSGPPTNDRSQSQGPVLWTPGPHLLQDKEFNGSLKNLR